MWFKGCVIDVWTGIEDLIVMTIRRPINITNNSSGLSKVDTGYA